MGSRLFVGNLPYSSTEDDIRALFAPRWGVVEVRIVTDRDTGRSRGFGFVELETDDAKDAIAATDGAELGGRRLAVREAHERAPRRRSEPRPEVKVDSITRRQPPRDRPPFPGNGGMEMPPQEKGGDRPRGRRWSPDGQRRDRPDRERGAAGGDEPPDDGGRERGGKRGGRKNFDDW